MPRRSVRIGGYVSAIISLLYLASRYSKSESNFLADIPLPIHIETNQVTKVPPRSSEPKEHPPPIQVSGSLPSLSDWDIDQDIREAWEETLKSVKDEAVRLFKAKFRQKDRETFPEGLPGTPISSTDEFRDLQAYLDCVAVQGQWVYDPQGRLLNLNQPGLTVHKHSSAFAACDKKFYSSPSPSDPLTSHWNVRESLKFRWQPSQECKAKFNLPEHMIRANTSLPTRKSFCKHLKGKHILLVGDAPSQYFVHDLLLDWTSDVPLSCYGDLYCSEHEICADWTETEDGGKWENDVMVYNKLPLAPIARGAASEGGQTASRTRDIASGQKSRSSSARLRYRRADGLNLHKTVNIPAMEAFYIHEATGVREINNYAAPDVRRSDLVILSKAPIPLPLDAGQLGYLTRAIRRAPNMQDKIKAVFRAVQKVTEDVWLPEAITALYDARSSNFENLLVWRSGWRVQPDCVRGSQVDEADQSDDFNWLRWWDSAGDGPPPFESSPTLKQLFFAADGTRVMTDLDSLFYNLQTVIQNEVIRRHILPPLGVVYLDMETPMSVWRSGMLGGTGYKPFGDLNASLPLPPMARNCLQPCIPSAGMSTEEALIGGLHRALTWAFDGDRDFSSPA